MPLQIIDIVRQIPDDPGSCSTDEAAAGNDRICVTTSVFGDEMIQPSVAIRIFGRYLDEHPRSHGLIAESDMVGRPNSMAGRRTAAHTETARPCSRQPVWTIPPVSDDRGRAP